MSFLTSFCDLPQNEQLGCHSGGRLVVAPTLLALKTNAHYQLHPELSWARV